jgi:hypothetical protein
METTAHSQSDAEQTQPKSESFDPEARLAEISAARNPENHDETKKQLAEYKVELEKQKDELSSTILSIYYHTKLKPNMTEAELFQMTDGHSFNDKQKKLFQDGIGELVKQRDRVQEIKKKELTPADQFEDIFGFKPKGEVTVEYSPTGIILKCDNPNDFEEAHNLSSVSDQRIDSSTTQAFALSVTKGQVPAEWEYTSLPIVARMDSDQKVIDHEEQHKYYTFFRARKPLDIGAMTERAAKRETQMKSELAGESFDS